MHDVNVYSSKPVADSIGKLLPCLAGEITILRCVLAFDARHCVSWYYAELVRIIAASAWLLHHIPQLVSKTDLFGGGIGVEDEGLAS